MNKMEIDPVQLTAHAAENLRQEKVSGSVSQTRLDYGSKTRNICVVTQR